MSGFFHTCLNVILPQSNSLYIKIIHNLHFSIFFSVTFISFLLSLHYFLVPIGSYNGISYLIFKLSKHLITCTNVSTRADPFPFMGLLTRKHLCCLTGWMRHISVQKFNVPSAVRLTVCGISFIYPTYTI